MDLEDIARRLSSRLCRSGPVPIQSCRLGCVSYRAGRRLRVVYRLGIDGRVVHVAASTFRSSSRGERAYRKAMESARNIGLFRPVVYDAELETVYWTFPNDRRIECLSAVVNAEEEVSCLIEGRWSASRLIDYYPEASAVVACLDNSLTTVAYAKVHAEDQEERTRLLQSAWSRLARGSRLHIARPLAYSRRYRTLVVEPIVGTPLGALSGGGLLAGLHAYGVALGTLHSLPAGVDTGGRDALERLKHRAASVRLVRPDVAQPVGELLDELSARWAGAAGVPVPVHGDTNENNAILQGDRVALIDFDRASVGADGSDIGNLLGLLRYFRSLGLISPQVARARAVAFTRGYASVRALPHRDSLRVHESAAVAERAFRAVTRLRRPSLLQVPALLEEAKELLR